MGILAIITYGICSGKISLFLYTFCALLFLINKNWNFNIKNLNFFLLALLFLSGLSHQIAYVMARRLIYDQGLVASWYIKFATYHMPLGPGGFMSSLLGFKKS